MVAQILQNIIFSLEAFCRLCVALIPISQTSICILTYIDSTLLSQKTLTHVHPHIFPLDISPGCSPQHSAQDITPPMFNHSGNFYSAPSSPLLLRGAPGYSTDTVSEFHAEAHRQLQVKGLPKVPTWRLERESNPRPSG